jgi:branched-chain amino acid transport system substrate-binding protein
MKRIHVLSLVLVLGFFLVGSAFAAAAKVEKIRIGVIEPFSGADAKYGELVKPAFQYAVDQVNKAGGIKSLGGAKLELVWGDHQSKQEVAISEIERLVKQEKVSVTAGAELSGIVMAATTAAERLQVPFVVDVPAAAEITTRGLKYVHRTNISGTFYGKTFVEFVNYLNKEANLGVKRVAISFKDTSAGKSFLTAVNNEAKNAGFDVVFFEAYPPDQPDMTTILTRVKAQNPDALATNDTGASGAILFTKTSADLGLKLKVFITADGAYEFVDWQQGVGKLRDGIFMMTQWNEDIADPRLLADYAKFTKEPLNTHSLLCMQAVYAIAEALEIAKSDDPKVIRDALAKVKINKGPRLVMPWDFLDYDDETGQNLGAANIVVQYQGDKLVTVYPPAVAKGKPIVPFDYWKNR